MGLQIGGQLHDEDRKSVGVREVRAPVLRHGAELLLVERAAAAHVGAALVPDRALEGHREERVQHRVVAGGGRPAVHLAVGGGRVVAEPFAAPRARQRDGGAVGGGERHVPGLAGEAAGLADVDDLDGDDIAPLAQDAGGHLVDARHVPDGVGADEDAVHPRDVDVVDRPERERRPAGGLRGREVERAPVPGAAVEALVELVLEADGDLGLGPRRIVEAGALGGDVALRRALRLPEGEAALVFRLAAGRVVGGEVGDRLVDLRALRGTDGAVGLLGQPGLDRRAGPRRLDEADRDVRHGLAQRLAEEPAAGRERLGVREAGARPRGGLGEVGERRRGGGVAVVEEAHPRVVGRFHVLLAPREAPAVAHVHVGLSGAEPHVAEEDVLRDERRVGAGGGQVAGREPERTAGGMRGKDGAPAAVGARDRDGLDGVPLVGVVAYEPDLHVRARFGGAPDGELDVALQHGVAAEHRRKGERRGGQGRGGEEGEREEASFHFRTWGKRLRMARNSTIFARRSQDRRAS